jgi:beta-N-acetylhexosaminidase
MRNSFHPLGSHLIVGLHGTAITEPERVMLKRLQPAGLILFARNFSHREKYAEWVNRLNELYDEVRSLTGRERLLISIDHEGGHVVRVPGPLTKFPYACQYVDNAYRVGQAMAVELSSIGVNVSWAPVADIHSNPRNPVIGARAFGTDARSTSKASVEFLHGLHSKGVAGCAKHFPGHGDTSVDSHFELPVQLSTLDEIRHREMNPFMALFEADVPLVMAAHMMFSNIDAQEPATLSRKFLTEILREELKFKGVVVSDDLEMKAVSERFTKGDALAKAFHAGIDMTILARSPAHDVDIALMMEQQFDEAYSRGVINDSLLKDSKSRIELLLSRLSQQRAVVLSKNIFLEHCKLAIDCS